MASRRSRTNTIVVVNDEPLIGLILEEDGREVVRYFANESDAREALPVSTTGDALALAGAWSDLDWDSMVHALDRIRHESPPSALLSL